MRTTVLDALLPGNRQRILAATLLRPDAWWYMADLARHLGVRPSSLQRELPSLVASGILRRRRDGRQVYYRADPDCPILSELQSILRKTVGLCDVLRDALAPSARAIRAAFVHGSIARGDAVGTSDIDLLIVGDVSLATLAPALHAAEQQLGRDVNPTVYPPVELAEKLAGGHPFLREVIASPKLWVLGTPDDLEGPAGRS